MAGADANPYLAEAATIAAGLRGVDEGLDCGPPYQGNAYIDSALSRLPNSLDQAADLLSESAFAREALGSDVVDYYVHTARKECEAFHAAVTDWERVRYFERI
jgi:glutamine synthetase